MREGKIERRTKEAEISVNVNLDGSGTATSDTGTKFLDHMICTLGKHAMMDVEVRSKSVDDIKHHLIEDTAIALGSAIDKALGDRTGIVRFGHASVPLDESLSEATVDLVRRPYHSIELKLGKDDIEDITIADLKHFIESLSQNINACIHVTVRYGVDDHHKVESAMKALAVALRAALSKDAKAGIPSTKGKM